MAVTNYRTTPPAHLYSQAENNFDNEVTTLRDQLVDESEMALEFRLQPASCRTNSHIAPVHKLESRFPVQSE